MGKFEDFSHRRFGSMEVIERAYKPNDKHTFWWCKCDCGKEFISRADGIKYSREYSFNDLKGDNKPLHFDFAVFNN